MGRQLFSVFGKHVRDGNELAVTVGDDCFGVDIATAFTLDAKQTDALADKITACFSLDLTSIIVSS